MTAEPLVYPDDISTYTKGAVSSSDPRLPGLIDGATAAIRRYCGWHIAPPLTETVTVDGPGGDVLTLPTLNLTDLAAMTEDGTALDAATLEWSALGSVRKPAGYWTARYRGITATMTHGYDSAPDVAQIVIQVITAALSSPMGATTESAGSFSVKWATTAPGTSGGLSLLRRDLDVLDAYKLRGA